MRVAIHQPNYLPSFAYWRKLVSVDVFIIFDDVQFPHDSHSQVTNRCAIKTQAGVQQLSVPVRRGAGTKKILAVDIANDGRWQRKHWRTLQFAYAKAPHFDFVAEVLNPFYKQREWGKLCDLNIALLEALRDAMGVTTKLVRSSELGITDEDTGRRLGRLVQAVAGTIYLSGTGPGSMRYVREQRFQAAGIKLEWLQFEHPIYPQLWGEFVPNLSIVDLLFNCGPDSHSILLS